LTGKWNEISNYFANMHKSYDEGGEKDENSAKQIESAIKITEKITAPIILAIRDKK